MNNLNNLTIAIIILVAAELIGFLLIQAKKETKKIKNEKIKQATNKLLDIVTKCVTATNQTFVKDLKERGKFDRQAAEEAWNQTKNEIDKVLDAESKTILNQAYGNLNKYIDNAIETEVYKQNNQ